MVIFFRSNVLILIDILSNISLIMVKILCRHSTNVLCLLGWTLARGGGGGTWVFRGAHTFVIKIKKFP